MQDEILKHHIIQGTGTDFILRKEDLSTELLWEIFKSLLEGQIIPYTVRVKEQGRGS